MEKNHQYPHNLQPFDFFYVFSETHPPNEEHPFSNKVQPSSSFSSSNVVVSTDLALSTFSSRPKTKPTNNSNRNITSYSYKPRSSSSNSDKKKPKKGFSDNNNYNNSNWGCSTTLKLYDDPWKIKKVLTASDLGKLNRLLLGSEIMENLVLPMFQNNHNNNDDDDADNDNDNYNNNEELLMAGKTIRVWDVQTMSMHELALKRWASCKNYVLIGNWTRDFVKRRALKKGDEIGLHWDSYNHCFNSSVLKRAT